MASVSSSFPMSSLKFLLVPTTTSSLADTAQNSSANAADTKNRDIVIQNGGFDVSDDEPPRLSSEVVKRIRLKNPIKVNV